MAMTSTYCGLALFYVPSCGQIRHVLCVRVCSTSTTVASGHGIILMLSANMGIKSASASVLELESSRDMVVCPYSLPDRLTAQRYDYLENFYWCCLKICF
jgi:hypothetical protein